MATIASATNTEVNTAPDAGTSTILAAFESQGTELKKMIMDAENLINVNLDALATILNFVQREQATLKQQAKDLAKSQDSPGLTETETAGDFN